MSLADVRMLANVWQPPEERRHFLRFVFIFSLGRRQLLKWPWVLFFLFGTSSHLYLKPPREQETFPILCDLVTSLIVFEEVMYLNDWPRKLDWFCSKKKAHVRCPIRQAKYRPTAIRYGTCFQAGMSSYNSIVIWGLSNIGFGRGMSTPFSGPGYI